MNDPNLLLTELAACLCAELTPDGADEPDLCFCGVLPGRIAIADAGFECDNSCGMAWVRLDAAYPATGPGVVAEQQNSCGSLLGLDIEIGVLRCYDTPADGSAPEGAALAASVALQNEGMMAIRRAIKCCEALSDVDYILGLFTPDGPQGGLVGGAWSLSVVLD